MEALSDPFETPELYDLCGCLALEAPWYDVTVKEGIVSNWTLTALIFLLNSQENPLFVDCSG